MAKITNIERKNSDKLRIIFDKKLTKNGTYELTIVFEGIKAANTSQNNSFYVLNTTNTENKIVYVFGAYLSYQIYFLFFIFPIYGLHCLHNELAVRFTFSLIITRWYYVIDLTKNISKAVFPSFCVLEHGNYKTSFNLTIIRPKSFQVITVSSSNSTKINS